MTLSHLVRLMRPHHWLKNLLLLFPPLFGGALFRPDTLRLIPVVLASFCLASSATYVINDLFDADRDALHPDKKHRPLAAGLIGKKQAATLAIGLLTASLLLALTQSSSFVAILLIYLLLSFLYSLRLKTVPLLDIFCIATFFLLRVEAGGNAFGIWISQWLFLSVFLLAVFLSTGKRLGELQRLGDEASSHRQSLAGYPPGFLDSAMNMSGAAVLVTYTMYVIARPALVYTVPLCCYGLFRYTLLVKAGGNGDPTASVLGDRQLFSVTALWLAFVGLAIYVIV